MLEIEKFVRLGDNTFMVGFIDENHNAILTLRLTKGNILDLVNRLDRHAP